MVLVALPRGAERLSVGRTTVTIALLAEICWIEVGVGSGLHAHWYTCRYLRTNRMLIMFIAKVMMKSSKATAKMDLYSMLPVAKSPAPAAAI